MRLVSRRACLPLVAAVVALAAAACGGGGGGSSTKASAEGVTADTVTIGSHMPLTGPAAPGYSKIAPASKAYFDFVNANGGVNGRKINYIFRDDAYNPTNTVNVVKQLVLDDKVFAIFDGLGTPTHSQVTDFLNQRKVPDVFVASGSRLWNNVKENPYTFGWQADYTVEGKILGNYIKQNFPGKRVGVFLQNDDFGKDGLAGLEQVLGAQAIVERQTYVSSNTDVTPQITALQAAKADVVVSFTIPAFTALEKLAMLKLNFSPQLVVSNVGADTPTLSGLVKNFSKGAASEAILEGVISDSYMPSIDDDANSWVQLFKKVNGQYNGNAPYDGNVQFGMAVAYTFVQSLKEAGTNPTRESFVKAIEKSNLRGAGLTPFRFSDKDHSGFSGVQVGKIQGGKSVLSGPVYVTDDGSGAITEYTEKQPPAPANGIG